MENRIMARGLEQIAKRHLDFETLETQNNDSLDHRECAVWRIKAALEAAYKLGKADEKMRVLEYRRGVPPERGG